MKMAQIRKKQDVGNFHFPNPDKESALECLKKDAEYIELASKDNNNDMFDLTGLINHDLLKKYESERYEAQQVCDDNTIDNDNNDLPIEDNEDERITTKRDNQLEVIDNFVSFQGEGRFTGQRAYFIRFRKCNLMMRCPIDCDTKEFMLNAVPYHLNYDNIIMSWLKTGFLVITGGEPTLYIDDICNLIRYFIHNYDHNALLKQMGYKFPLKLQIETNGYKLLTLVRRLNNELCLAPSIFRNNILPKIYYSFSPKFIEKEYIANKAYKYANIIHTKYAKYHQVDIKIVVHRKWEINKLRSIVANIGWISTHLNKSGVLWLMPYGITTDEIISNLQFCALLCDKYNCNLSTRLHFFAKVK